MENAIFQFMTEGIPVSCTHFGNGHINSTFLICTDCGTKYILQQINCHVFQDPERLMHNVIAVSEHILSSKQQRQESLRFIRTKEGSYLYTDEAGIYWRCYQYINGICLDSPETEHDLYECAVAFGSFIDQLSDFPAESLFEIIPDFHNTPVRINNLRNAVSRDSCGRVSLVKKELDYLFSMEHTVSLIQQALDERIIPLRVTHNDTKLNNVLLDPVTRKALCVLDLDTVMPGSVLFDFGDAIRSGASTVAEDAMDLSQVGLDLHLFNIYLDGFLNSCPSLTHKEIEMLPLGVLTLTVELASRFLTDYLEGDHYFKIDYRDHNLIRARAQIRLAQDIAVKMDSMNEKVSNSVSRQKTELILNAK